MKYLKRFELSVNGDTFKEWLRIHKLSEITDTLLNCNNRNLIDLDGIQKFKNLELLFCHYNKLTKLNLDGLYNLKTLFCHYNYLNQLNLTEFKELQHLNCHHNKLESLRVEGLSKLKTLDCSNNKLTYLDLDGLDDLQELICDNNELPYGDLEGYWEWFQKEHPDRWEAMKFNF